MSITTALKKLAKNVFNVDTTGNNIDEILDDIANNASVTMPEESSETNETNETNEVSAESVVTCGQSGEIYFVRYGNIVFVSASNTPINQLPNITVPDGFKPYKPAHTLVNVGSSASPYTVTVSSLGAFHVTNREGVIQGLDENVIGFSFVYATRDELTNETNNGGNGGDAGK